MSHPVRSAAILCSLAMAPVMLMKRGSDGESKLDLLRFLLLYAIVKTSRTYTMIICPP